MGSGQELERFADSHNFHILQALFDKSKDFFTSIAYITPQGVQEYAALGPGYSDRDTDLGTDPLVADCLNAPNRIVSAVRLSRKNGPQLVLALSKRSPFGTNMLKLADLEMDLVARSVRRAGKPIELKPKEFALLEYLMGLSAFPHGRGRGMSAPPQRRCFFPGFQGAAPFGRRRHPSNPASF